MMKMKLRAVGGENHRCDLSSVNGTGAARLDKEAVFEWFGLQLSPAGRVELLCGLLHMCQPLELRFLAACLEDLARRDFTVLRDFEIRANCPSDLEGLVDVSDPVVLSKMLVYLSLLGSKSRECAGILFRALSRMDAGMCGALPEPETLDQLRLLFTMGSLHPAFSFHQREELRAQLERLQRWNQFSCPHRENSVDWTVCSEPNGHLSGQTQREVVHIKKIILKDITLGGDGRQYSFEVMWSDSSSTTITKSHRELEDFLLKVPKEQSPDGFEKAIVRLLSRDQCESRDLETNLREKFLSLSQEVLHRCDISSFFLSDSPVLPCRRSGASSPIARIHQPERGFSEDCSETSSLEEDGETYQASGRSHQHSESQRRANCEQNGEGVWKKDGESEQSCTNDRRIFTAAQKSKARPAGKRERGRRANGPKSSNGIQKPSAALMLNQAACKDVARDRYVDTSSESSNSVPSSPVHQKSLEDRDTESQSDNSAEKTPLPKGVGGKAVALVSPLMADAQKAGAASSGVELALTACLPYALQYATTQRDPGQDKLTPPTQTPPTPEPATPPANTPPSQQPPPGAFSVLSATQPVKANAQSSPYPSHTPGPALTHDSLSQGGILQQQGGGCNACGCRGSCSAHQTPGYFLQPHPARQMFGPPPFFHLQPSLCNTFASQSNGTPLPFYAPTAPPAAAFLHHSEHVLGHQAGYTLPQIHAPFRRYYQPVFSPVGLMPGVKKPNNVSCYNCGMSGHYAQDCKQPSIDAGLTGGFRLKFVSPNSEAVDKTD